MRKCFILFIILVAALIFAAVSENKDIKIQSSWDGVAVKDHSLSR